MKFLIIYQNMKNIPKKNKEVEKSLGILAKNVSILYDCAARFNDKLPELEAMIDDYMKKRKKRIEAKNEKHT